MQAGFRILDSELPIANRPHQSKANMRDPISRIRSRESKTEDLSIARTFDLEISRSPRTPDRPILIISRADGSEKNYEVC